MSHPAAAVVSAAPRTGGDPYDPIARAENAALSERDEAEAGAMAHVTFVVRRARCAYRHRHQGANRRLGAFARLAKACRPAAERARAVAPAVRRADASQAVT